VLLPPVGSAGAAPPLLGCGAGATEADAHAHARVSLREFVWMLIWQCFVCGLLPVYLRHPSDARERE
jgi:hypothetical protein